MNKDEILELSRREHRNKDLAELEIAAKAGNIASRVGACVCVLLSVMFHCVTDTALYSPWVIYFSILGSHYAVRYGKSHQKTDLFLCIVFAAMCMLAFGAFGLRLWEVRG